MDAGVPCWELIAPGRSWVAGLAVAVGLAMAPGIGNAQVPAVRFEHLSVEDGLSHSAVLDITQDRYGFLWFATANGLSRYDGYGFVLFRHDPADPESLSGSYATKVLEDRGVPPSGGAELTRRTTGSSSTTRILPGVDQTSSLPRGTASGKRPTAPRRSPSSRRSPPTLVRRDTASGQPEHLTHSFDLLEGAAETMQRRLDDDLYEFSRLGQQSLKLQDVRLDEVVDEVVAEVAEAVAERHVKVVRSELPSVRGDRARLLELMRHLVHNALDHMGQPVAPLIEIGTLDAGNGDAATPVVYVRDNGRGIESPYREKIFELFEQLTPETSTGTGIGLALVRRIVESHGGRIWVESEGRNQGATFCFTLSA